MLHTTALIRVLALSAGFAVHSFGSAQETRAPNTAMTDRDFVATAASADELERQAGALAAQRAQRREVRALGEQLVADHTRSTELLTAAAAAAQISAPAARLHPGQERALQHLRDAPAEQFDQLFLQQQVETHTDALGLMRTCVSTCDEQALRGAAQEIAPAVSRHLARALNIQREFE